MTYLILRREERSRVGSPSTAMDVSQQPCLDLSDLVFHVQDLCID